VLDGREWDESLRERLIRPLGLTRTVTLPEEAILHRVATGHREHPHPDQPVSIWGLRRSIGPAGNITASAADVLTFARMHLDGGVTADGARLLSAASVVDDPSGCRSEAGSSRLRLWDVHEVEPSAAA
jgi:CubicO group peptidase (beta-lactamase class C family)